MARYLALDWDQNQLHIVAATIRGTSVQVQRATVWQESRVPNPAEAEELGQLLRDRLKEAGIAPAPVLACVSRDRVIVKEVRFPAVPDGEEPAIVRFQAVKELTDSPDDVIIDYLTTGTGSSGERKASAVVIRRELLSAYQKICQSAGLKLAALTPRMVGVSACLRSVIGKTVVTPPPEPADGVIAVVVVGEKSAELSVLRDAYFVLARSLPAASNLASDIRRNLAVYGGQQPQHPIRAVYVTGKGTGELRERLGELIEIPVHTFDPFCGSDAAGLPTGNRGSFAAAVGLLHAQAIATAEATGRSGPPINFVSPRQPKPPANNKAQLIRAALVGWVLLFFGLLAISRVAIARMNESVDGPDGYEAQREEGEQKLVRTRANADLLKTIDNWDNPVWLDELYDLTARIPDVNALRVTSIQAEPLQRTAHSKFAAKVTIKGKLLNKTNPRKAVHDLVALFGKEGYYTPGVPGGTKDVFTLVVLVERRPPTMYEARLAGERAVPKPPQEIEESKNTKKGTSTKNATGKKNKASK